VAALNAMRAVHFPTCLPHPLKGAEGYVLCQNNDQLRAIVYDFLRVPTATTCVSCGVCGVCGVCGEWRRLFSRRVLITASAGRTRYDRGSDGADDGPARHGRRHATHTEPRRQPPSIPHGVSAHPTRHHHHHHRTFAANQLNKLVLRTHQLCRVAAIDPFLEEVKGTPFEHHEFVR
jgi:hypothetical protein